MKIVMDEKLKHRLIGLAVIISLGTIFLPAIMKKSSQKLEGNFSVHVKLPPKPLIPVVSVTDKKELFKTLKVARVSIPAVSDKQQLPEFVKAQTIIPSKTPADYASVIASKQVAGVSKSISLALNESAKITTKHTVKTVLNAPVKTIQAKVINQKNIAKKAVKVARKTSINKDIYAVQLASFAKKANAEALINRLHNKGYRANFTQVLSKSGALYKVYVGHSPQKNRVLKLKNQLATSMQLHGVVVNTRVS